MMLKCIFKLNTDSFQIEYRFIMYVSIYVVGFNVSHFNGGFSKTCREIGPAMV